MATSGKKTESTPHETMKRKSKRRGLPMRKKKMIAKGMSAQGVRYKT